MPFLRRFAYLLAVPLAIIAAEVIPPAIAGLSGSTIPDSRAGVTSTSPSGAFSITWTPPLRTSTPYAGAFPISNSTTQLAGCNIASSTPTGVSGNCFVTQSSTVGALGSIVNPVTGDASATVRVFARDLTQ